MMHCHVKFLYLNLIKRFSSYNYDVVIIGGGVFGSSLLYHLTKENLCNVALFEKNKLTSGTTWHTAGLVWRLRPNDTEIQLLNYSRSLMKKLENTGWCENGGLFLASSQERMKEYHRLYTLGKLFDIESYMLKPSEICFLHPLINSSLLEGALYSPGDGTVDPNAYCTTLTNVAKKMGAKVYENAKVIAIHTDIKNNAKIGKKNHFSQPKINGLTINFDWQGGFNNSTPHIAEVKTPLIVNCTGVWAPSLARSIGITLPQIPLLHSYILSDSLFDKKGKLLPKYLDNFSRPQDSNTQVSSIKNEKHPNKFSGKLLPNIRDHDRSVYIKLQGGQSFAFGGYENNPAFVFQSDNMTPPLSDNPFNLFDLNWEVFDQNLRGCMEIVPILKVAGIKSTVCGYESFTPDHKPILGESLEVKGYYHGSGFNSSGMMLSGGCGSEMAKLIARGYTDLDMYHFDIRRFNKRYTDDTEWVINRSHEAYAKNYSIVFPYDEPLAGRNLRHSPLYKVLLEKGCVYQERHGWERPGWFISPDSVHDKLNIGRESLAVKSYDFYGAYPDKAKVNENHPYAEALKCDYTFDFPKHHFTLLKSECVACRTSVAIFDMSYFSKLYLCASEPADGHAIVDRLFCSNIPCSSSSTNSSGKKNTFYTCALDESGGIQCDLTVSVLDTNKLVSTFEPKGALYYLAVGGGIAQYFQTHAERLICEMIDNPNRHKLQDPSSIQLIDVTDNAGLISLQGPLSREIIGNLVDVDLSNENFPFSSHQNALFGPNKVPVRLVRVSFVGEMGWEIHAAREDCLYIYDTITDTGKRLTGKDITNAGYRAIDSLSLEKGYYHWHAEIRTEDTPFEAGLGFTCNKMKNVSSDFLGKQALMTTRSKDKLLKKIAFFSLNEKVPLFGLETIWRNGECVGFLRRAGYGYTLDKSIGFGYIHSPSFTYVEGIFKLKEPVTYIDDKYITDPMAVYEIESFGKKYLANVYSKSPFDPKNKRIQGLY